MVEHIDIFPVPIFRSTFDNAELLQSSVVPIFKDIESKDINPVRYSANGYTSYGKYDIFDLQELAELKTFICNTVYDINQQVGINSAIELKGGWFSINRQYSYHEMHNHVPDIWSGVYYVQASRTDAALTFANKNLESNWPYTSSANSNYTSSVVNCAVETGVLYIFPSYLNHKVDQQMEDNERITVSFNFGAVE